MPDKTQYQLALREVHLIQTSPILTILEPIGSGLVLCVKIDILFANLISDTHR